MLASTRLCANVPAQYAIQTSLGGYQSIDDLTKPTGRLYRQRDIVYERLNQMEGVSCVKPQGALYAFPKLDVERFNITDDTQFALDLLNKEKILLVQGQALTGRKTTISGLYSCRALSFSTNAWTDSSISSRPTDRNDTESEYPHPLS